MYRGVLLLTFGVLTVSTSPVLAQKKKGGEAAAAQNGWIFSLTEGKARAEKLNKPLMVVMRCVP